MPVKDILAALFVALLWGLNFVAIGLGLAEMPPILFAALRFAAIWPLLLIVPLPRVAWGVVLAIGVILGTVKFALLFIGMDVGASPGLASLVLQSQALFTFALAALFLGERVGGRQLLGLALVIAAALAWAVANVILKRAGSADMLRLFTWISLVPPLPLLLLSWQMEGVEAWRVTWQSLTATGVLALLYTSFVALVLGFAIWGRLIAAHGASRVAPFSLAVPLVGMGASAVVFGEDFGALRLAAAALVLSGLALVVWRR